MCASTMADIRRIARIDWTPSQCVCVRKPCPWQCRPCRFSHESLPPPLPHQERWPSQTSSENANQGLEPQLAALVTTARQWLIERGFLTTDGPLAGVVGVNGVPGGVSGGGGGPYGVGWRKAVVARTHAAMCASALLTPGWGSGHQIMGAAEQVRPAFREAVRLQSALAPKPPPLCSVVYGGVGRATCLPHGFPWCATWSVEVAAPRALRHANAPRRTSLAHAWRNG